jgi:hypothetical protein
LFQDGALKCNRESAEIYQYYSAFCNLLFKRMETSGLADFQMLDCAREFDGGK